ncbi:hypothetical protein GGI23_005220 [Coemansia sp. RSA 2559]|nr:hypothetical protein GGI23_005220 [Coemansia sp. RSA 2559]
MDLAERSYWDQYDGDMDHLASRTLPSQHHFSAINTGASSRDSYWSWYVSSAKSTATGHRTPVSRNEPSESPASVRGGTSIASMDTQAQRRLFVIPERLAALRLDGNTDEREKKQQGRGKLMAPPGAGVAVSQNTAWRSSSSAVPVPVTAEDGDALENQQPMHVPAGRQNEALGVDAMRADNAGTAVPQNLDMAVTAAAERSNSQAAAGSEDNDEASIDSPHARSYQGVNPAALITRLNFLKEQMDQDERLFLNPVV